MEEEEAMAADFFKHLAEEEDMVADFYIFEEKRAVAWPAWSS